MIIFVLYIYKIITMKTLSQHINETFSVNEKLIETITFNGSKSDIKKFNDYYSWDESGDTHTVVSKDGSQITLTVYDPNGKNGHIGSDNNKQNDDFVQTLKDDAEKYNLKFVNSK